MVFACKALVGCWSLQRRITLGARLQGVAVFAPPGPDGGLHYREEGSLFVPQAGVMQAERDYYYVQAKDGFNVYFDVNQQRLFHSIRLEARGKQLAGSAVHYCGDDVYQSHYRFWLPHRFLIAHYVIGPRKDYCMVSVYNCVPSNS
jgi:hypothetical protein